MRVRLDPDGKLSKKPGVSFRKGGWGRGLELTLIVTGPLLAAIVTGFRIGKSLSKRRPRIGG
jgi:hypothetical protein